MAQVSVGAFHEIHGICIYIYLLWFCIRGLGGLGVRSFFGFRFGHFRADAHNSTQAQTVTRTSLRFRTIRIDSIARVRLRLWVMEIERLRFTESLELYLISDFVENIILPYSLQLLLNSWLFGNSIVNITIGQQWQNNFERQFYNLFTQDKAKKV